MAEITGGLQVLLIKFTLDSYEDTEVPNNVVGLRMGQSMNDAGLVIPAYEVDWNDGWKVKEIQDEYGNPITKSELLAAKVNENQTYTIVLYRELQGCCGTGNLVSGG